MTAVHRWAVVALGVLLVVTLPVVWLHRPTPDDDVSARDLLARVRDAGGRPWSGYVVSQGTLQLPVASRFTDLGTLFGEQNKLRVWWRGDDAWRVDRLTTAGEEDLVHAGDATTAYSFEDAEAVTSTDPDIRLPRTSDLLPPVLVERLLRDVDARQVSRLDTRRVGGRVAPGLRVRPASPQSSIDHVDLWADPATGIPLRPPAEVAGLAETSESDGAVGVYGTGLTQLIAIPLRGREAEPLRNQIGVTPGSQVLDGDTEGGAGAGTLVAVGPLGVLLTGSGDEGGFLLAGTVTGQTLREAALDIAAGTVYVGDR